MRNILPHPYPSPKKKELEDYGEIAEDFIFFYNKQHIVI
jgi:hypothetical protein